MVSLTPAKALHYKAKCVLNAFSFVFLKNKTIAGVV